MAEILCVKKDNLELDFQGFSSDKKFYKKIVDNGEHQDRDMLETNPDYKQPIAYMVFVKDGSALCYKRSGKGGEKRLYENYSIGFGGHIETYDGKAEEAIKNSLFREAEEELASMPKKFEPEFIGFINDDSNAVGQVHIGLLYIIELEEDIQAHEDEAGEGIFMNKQELDMIKDKMETWSQIAFDAIKDNYLE